MPTLEESAFLVKLEANMGLSKRLSDLMPWSPGKLQRCSMRSKATDGLDACSPPSEIYGLLRGPPRFALGLLRKRFSERAGWPDITYISIS